MAHPFAEPSIVLALVALACLAGQSWPSLRLAVPAAFALAAAAGVVAARLGIIAGPQQAGLLAVALWSALLAAALPAGNPTAASALAAAAGLLTGIASTPVLLPLRASLATIGGALIGSVLALQLLVYSAGNFRRRFGNQSGWIGLRIIASWAAAVALMMLALQFASNR
jgi:hypothetical protein